MKCDDEKNEPDNCEKENDFEGLIMALIYLLKEARRMKMTETADILSSSIEMAFVERFKDDLELEQLEKIQEIVERILKSPEEFYLELTKLMQTKK